MGPAGWVSGTGLCEAYWAKWLFYHILFQLLACNVGQLGVILWHALIPIASFSTVHINDAVVEKDSNQDQDHSDDASEVEFFLKSSNGLTDPRRGTLTTFFTHVWSLYEH